MYSYDRRMLGFRVARFRTSVSEHPGWRIELPLWFPMAISFACAALAADRFRRARQQQRSRQAFPVVNVRPGEQGPFRDSRPSFEDRPRHVGKRFDVK
jgi:hypothetical protein